MSFDFKFFHESSSPSILIIPTVQFFKFFEIGVDIHNSRCLTGVNDTGGKLIVDANDTGGTTFSKIYIECLCHCH
jgi:hypothetical protein